MSICLHPIHLTNGNVVPCNKCVNCRNRYRNQWSFRMQQEEKNCSRCLFVTLTYNDEHIPVKQYFFNDNFEILKDTDSRHWYILQYGCLPKYASIGKEYKNSRYYTSEEVKPFYPHSDYTFTVSKDDIMKFTDNLQHKFKKLGIGFKYFISSEYGSKRKRPHYHGIFFLYGDNVYKLNYSEIITSTWSNGIVDFENLTMMNGINYVTKYALKGADVPRGADSCFSLKSKGLGLSFLNDNMVEKQYQRLLNDNGMSVSFQGGQTAPMPRYYKDKIKSLLPSLTAEKIKFSERRKTREKSIDDRYRCAVNYYNLYGTYCPHNLPGVSIYDSKGNSIRLSSDLYDHFQMHYNSLETINYLEDGFRTSTETDGQ